MDSTSHLTSHCYSDSASTDCFLSSAAADGDLAALRRLSENLGTLLPVPVADPFADARIAVAASPSSSSPPREVAVHRCILSARSPFFKDLFSKMGADNSSDKNSNKGAGALKLQLRDLVGGFEVGYEALMAVLGYLYSGRVGTLPKGVCVCVDDECSHVGCRPAVDFLVQVLYLSFVFQISELVSLFQRHLLDILEKAVIDDILVIVSVANLCSKLCEKLLSKCMEIVIKSDLDTVTLEKALPPDVAKHIMKSRKSCFVPPESTSFPDKHVKRIHRALDSDDVELVRMLLKEGNTSLDDAYALHYAVAYCDSKITTELLDLGIADINHRNLRGYTVLHVAAMRKEPKIIVSLLTKGARPSDVTRDGRKAFQISKRLTRSIDYYKSIEEGKASPKDRLCIEILEQAERREPVIGEASVSLAMAGDDLRVKLLYLENRVALARCLFPMEARVAMDIAQVDGTLEFTLGSTAVASFGSQRTDVDLNEAPFIMKEEHLLRMKALSKTVELGKRFFPRCSEVLNRIMDDDITELTCLGRDSSEEKKRRYLELQDVVSKAFSEDKEEIIDWSTISSSSSSTTLDARTKIARQ